MTLSRVPSLGNMPGNMVAARWILLAMPPLAHGRHIAGSLGSARDDPNDPTVSSPPNVTMIHGLETDMIFATMRSPT